MGADAGWLKEHIRDIADFPHPGIGFKDITPLLAGVDAFRFAVDALVDHFDGGTIDKVVGIEARGFMFAAPVAYRVAAGFVPVRKPGRLPGLVEREAYLLEYGSDELEMLQDALDPGDRVLIVDDVLATGGTAAAAVRLVEKLGGQVIGLGFVLELVFLAGRTKLAGYEVASLMAYE